MTDAPLDESFVVIVRDLLIEHGRYQEGRREWAHSDAPGVREWVLRHSMLDEHRKTVDRGVAAAGGWQGICRAVFGDRNQTWRDVTSATPNATRNNDGDLPHHVFMTALARRRSGLDGR